MPKTVPAGGPVTSADRIAFLDILRGFAVMAIFIVNIKAMFMPFAFYTNPSMWGSEIDVWIANGQKFLVDDKWRTTFTALYGAGLLMIWDRLSARGADRGVLLRRNLWLIVFGAIHLFLIWTGDILFIYGVTGLVAMLFVRMKMWQLLLFGLLILTLGIAWMGAMSAAPAFVPEMHDALKPKFWAPGPEVLAEEIATMQGGIGGQVAYHVQSAIGYVAFYVIFGGMFAMTLGLMVTGMALFRLGLYRGAWPLAVTAPVAVLALGAAWTLDYHQIRELMASQYDFEVYSLNGWMALIDGVLGALGYACLISALVTMGLRFGPVAAVGRMAFTNYIACSLIGTTMAAGHGLGMYGDVSLVTLMMIVAIVLIAMLTWSPLWLRAFRFGPLEWLWRSLVYGTIQPILRSA